jgi:type VI secretion system protein VasG
VVEQDLALVRQQYDAELLAANRVIELRKKLAQERALESASDRYVTKQVTDQLIEAESALEALIADEKLIHIEVGPDTIAKIVSDRTGIPLGKMMRDQASEALSFEDDLKKKIKGQDEALARIAQILKGARSGLNDPNQPLGIFLLIGPSGVGKTETAISVADMMFGGEDSMISINMSEFQEKHSLSRLVGSPPGYVGFGEGGVLTEAVRRRPYSVVLLDEVEKASLDVLNLFYQVFDKGVLSDGEGREIDFKNTVIFLTSNLGLEEITRLCASGQALSQDIITEKIRPILSAHFKPALLARMTIVPFSTLSPPVLESIVRMKIQKLQDRLINKNKLKLEVTEDAIQAIVARCTEVETGARNIDFILKSVILPLLSDTLLTASSQSNIQTSMVLNLNSGGEFLVRFN